MRKFMTWFGLFFLLVLVIVTGILLYKFHTYKPLDEEIKVDEKNLSYFHENYDVCRTHFIKKATQISEKYSGTQIHSLALKNGSDANLTIDYCHIPAQSDSKRLLIISSGIHGIEGYTGSAVQIMFMDEILSTVNLDHTGILLIHGLNPYGFKNNLRFTENNVDLNRNSTLDENLYDSVNDGYRKLYKMLNPSGKVKSNAFRNFFFPVIAISKILQESLPVLRQAVLQGQYEFPEGLYFGGEKLEPSIQVISPVIKEIGSKYEIIMNIDLHTGYGARGHLHLFPNPIEDIAIRSDLDELFAGYTIDWGDGDDFYMVTGDFTGYIGTLLPTKQYLPMIFEYGTLDSQKMLGSIKSIHNMILINQLVQRGYKKEKDREKIESAFLEMYYPSSILWRSKIMTDSKILLKQVTKKFTELN